MGKNIFETNQDRGFHMSISEMERDCAVARRKAAGYGAEKFHEREPAFQRDVLAENNQAPLPVAVDELPFGADKKAAVEVIRIVGIGRIGSRLHIIGADDHPDMMSVGRLVTG